MLVREKIRIVWVGCDQLFKLELLNLAGICLLQSRNGIKVVDIEVKGFPLDRFNLLHAVGVF